LVLVPTASAAEPFVHVDAQLRRANGGGALVTGNVHWDRGAATREPDYMTEGDLRLLAVSEHGHRPTLLATATYARIAADPSQEVTLHIKGDDEDAIRRGNRVVLTASQHGSVPSGGARTERTYVTVEELQPFGDAQDRIGRRECADLPITPGANLNECDLTGADLDHALVSQRSPEERIGRMLLADLTGATARGAKLEGLSVAGGRLNGADLTNADLTNLSLAGAEATKLKARGAVSDPKEGVGGGNFYDTNLTDADFHGAVFAGVSMNHADLDGADFGDARWATVEAGTASFRGANLTGLTTTGITRIPWTDFTGADLKGAGLTATDLEWSTLCRTQMPGGRPDPLEDRDCRVKQEERPQPASDPAVVVKASLERGKDEVTVKGEVTWDGGESGWLSVGDLRLVAIDGRTDLPTPIAAETIDPVPAASPYEVKITDPKLLAAIGPGDRIVLTATQHPSLPESKSTRTKGSYVAVDTLQPGPGRGRVGSRDCSGTLLKPNPGVGETYDFCDLAGAVLTQAGISGFMREADLTGADLGNADLGGLTLSGSALGGAVMSGAELGGMTMIAATAPRLVVRKTRLDGAQWRSDVLDEANFEASVISQTIFATSSLRRAVFSEAGFVHDDFALTNLAGAKLDGVDAGRPDEENPNSLFLANLTGATLADSTWADDEEGNRPWQWATLCDTKMPPGAEESGDRDCPR
jgi:uncharacterized protein YjbI with pentapeptide repeats